MENIIIQKKLSLIQNELSVPKKQRNRFGNYNYRSCEDIIEAVKPICKKHGAVLVMSDELVNIGDRYYVKAIAQLVDIDNLTHSLSSTSFAREPLSKKGMDESQITGSASSYARKYALNGLLNIDDTKDADTDEYVKKNSDPKALIIRLINKHGTKVSDIAKKLNISSATATMSDVEKIRIELGRVD